jgi:hypothetical protein
VCNSLLSFHSMTASLSGSGPASLLHWTCSVHSMTCIRHAPLLCAGAPRPSNSRVSARAALIREQASPHPSPPPCCARPHPSHQYVVHIPIRVTSMSCTSPSESPVCRARPHPSHQYVVHVPSLSVSRAHVSSMRVTRVRAAGQVPRAAGDACACVCCACGRPSSACPTGWPSRPRASSARASSRSRSRMRIG